MKHLVPRLSVTYLRAFYESFELFTSYGKDHVFTKPVEEILEEVKGIEDEEAMKKVIYSYVQLTPDVDDDGEPFDPEDKRGADDCARYIACELIESKLAEL